MIPIYIMTDAQPFRLHYLFIGGGGGGKPNIYPSGGGGGGGGAGGYINGVPGEQSGGPSTAVDPLVFYGGEAITVTVGAGGNNSSSGSDTVFGSVTAFGGGFGENISSPSGDGGSGGGAPFFNGVAAGSGTTDQGNDGGLGSQGGNFPANGYAGGGGGAAEPGNTDGTSWGGDGLASSITGTSVFRGGGGGGTNAAASVPVPGGDGGGGTGRAGDLRNPALANATNGVVNTGGGGGGGDASGGSGLIVLRYPSRSRVIDYIGPGLTYSYSDDGTWKRYIFTSGSDTIRF